MAIRNVVSSSDEPGVRDGFRITNFTEFRLKRISGARLAHYDGFTHI